MHILWINDTVNRLFFSLQPLQKLSVADNRLRQDADVIIDSLGTNDKLEELDIR